MSERGGSGPPRHDAEELYVHSRGAAQNAPAATGDPFNAPVTTGKKKLTAGPESEVFGAASLGATR